MIVLIRILSAKNVVKKDTIRINVLKMLSSVIFAKKRVIFFKIVQKELKHAIDANKKAIFLKIAQIKE